MRCIDINVLVYAHRTELPDSDAYSAWIEESRVARELLAVPSLVVSGFVRLVTNRRIFPDPTPMSMAWDLVHKLRESDSVEILEPGPRHLALFEELCVHANATGNLVTDAYIAAMAVERGATLYSADRDFARFDGLRWKHPLNDQ